MINYKKLKNGFSMAELLVALSIFALISTIGLTALGFMIKTQYSRQLELEKQFINKFNSYSRANSIFSQNYCPPSAP
jgi:prepilin-type N-terminal cleavage/methylation domain-containing protein